MKDTEAMMNVGTASSTRREPAGLTSARDNAATGAHAKRRLSGAYGWLVVFFVVYCARPEDWIPPLRFIPLAKIAGFFVLIACLLSVGQVQRKWPREVLYLLLLFFQLCLTVPFSPVWMGGAFQYVMDFSKVVLIIVAMVAAVNTLARLRQLIFVQCASVAMIAMAAVVKGRHNLGRLEGAIGGIYSNPNDLAFAIVLTLPFCFAFWLDTKSVFRKALWAWAMLVMTGVVFLSGSRAGVLALVVAGGICLWEFGVKGQRRYLLFLAAVAALAVVILAGGKIAHRFKAMFRPDFSNKEDVSAYGSALQRRELLWRSIVVTVEHPLFGVGPGNFTSISGAWHETHNSYTQVSSEGGIPAFILYVLILWRAFANVRDAKRLIHEEGYPRLLAPALRASLASFAIGSFFDNVAYHFFPYFLFGYTTALLGIVSGAYTASPAKVMEMKSKAKPYEEAYGSRKHPRTIRLA